MKRILAMILAVVLCVTPFGVVAQAAANDAMPLSVTATAGEGNSVIVTVKANKSFDFGTLVANVDYDENVFTRNGNGTFNSNYDMGYDYECDGFMMSAKNVDVEPYMDNVPADTVVATYEFTYADNAAAGEYSFDLELTIWENGDFESLLPSNPTANAKFNIGSADPVTGYTAGVSTSTPEVTVGDAVTVSVAVDHSSDAYFNAAEFSLSYDATALELDTSSLSDVKYEAANGVVTVYDFGGNKNFGDAYTIGFTTKKVVDASVVTLSSAKFIDKEGATESDLESATIAPASVSFKINEVTYDVTLPTDGNVEGLLKATKGQDYTFTVKEANNYDYTVTVMVGGEEVAVTGSNGVYTIPGAEVDGDIVISYERTGKKYDVVFAGTGSGDGVTGAAQATYSVDYTFTLPANVAPSGQPGATFTLGTVTIGGVAYTGATSSDGKTYTIPGAAITGAISIEVVKTVLPPNSYTVTVTGATGDATVESASVVEGTTAKITIAPETGYSYTVTATMGGEAANVVTAGNVYTVANVMGDVVFNVVKTLDVSSVAVAQYITLDEVGFMYIVTFSGELNGKVPTYNGEKMFWSDKYTAFCYLVIAETLTADEAKAQIGATEAKKADKVVYYDTDINLTGISDAADAQVVWNMYNAEYSNFASGMTMAQFLAADQNGTKSVDVADARAIIDSFLTSAAQ